MQLIHIEGPLKGEIQEFPEAEVTIGPESILSYPVPKRFGGGIETACPDCPGGKPLQTYRPEFQRNISERQGPSRRHT